jgi:uroporphyrinogen-III synthase
VFYFRKVFGKETGNAAKLSSKIVSDYEERDRPIQFVFPCGNLKQDILPTKLTESSIDLDCVEVYETQPHIGIEDAIRGLKDKINSVDMVFFFSPSGATFTLPVLEQYFPDIRQSCNFFAMGPSSTESLKEKGCSNIFTLNNPTVEGLINAFKAVANGTINSS